ncbi:MAG: hypothetical protein L6Q54_08605 [Leptospiraceae bacterium]|nr:hypothetical protein [Leptospiraceae bacterium]MCK6381294.1 hypothetical protein [Leptospiraceae bacterium]NUM40393.1 hypothetical protein [Leptospiraceae bacterium]
MNIKRKSEFFIISSICLLSFLTCHKIPTIKLRDFPFQKNIEPSHTLEFPVDSDWFNTKEPLTKDKLLGKVVFLNFLSYTCINCEHILQDLKSIERKWSNELAVITIYSDRNYSKEKNEIVRQAILLNDIDHPVVIDKDFSLWQTYNLNSWPTLIIIHPNGEILGQFSGEDIFQSLDSIVSEVVKDSESSDTLNRNKTLPLKKTIEPERLLYFPEKLAIDAKEKLLYVSDSKNNRILKIHIESGEILESIGSGYSGNKDGDYDSSEFNHPQGIFLKDKSLFVADTKNHSIRKIHLEKKVVETIAGNFSRARTIHLPGFGKNVNLSSPKDILELQGTLYIAMSGHHQIWKMDLKTSEIDLFIGSGNNNLLDGNFKDASLSHPYRMTYHDNTLYFTDRETNAIRSAKLIQEKVDTLAGKGIFESGDVDGIFPKTRLQNPSDLFYHDGLIYFSDSQNHKIKTLNPITKEIKTLIHSKNFDETVHANKDNSFEPSGISLFQNKIYFADIKNHSIRILDLKTKELSELKIKTHLNIFKNKNSFYDKFQTYKLKEIKISPKSNFLNLNIRLSKGFSWKYNSPFYFKKTSLNENAVKFLSPKEEYLQRPKFPVSFPIQTISENSEIQIHSVLYYNKLNQPLQELLKKVQIQIKVIVDRYGVVNPTVDLEI